MAWHSVPLVTEFLRKEFFDWSGSAKIAKKYWGSKSNFDSVVLVNEVIKTILNLFIFLLFYKKILYTQPQKA